MSKDRPGPRLLGAARTVAALVTPDAFEGVAPDETAEQADVYLPEGTGPHPSVVLVHGGGFLLGSRRMKPARYLAARLREAGFAVCVPGYDQVLRGGTLQSMTANVEEALRWWLESQERLELDPSRIALCGLSAGATLSLRAAERLPEGSLSRVVSVFGLYDLGSMRGPLAALIGPAILRTRDPEQVAAESPLNRPPLQLPLTLLHGTADTLVPYEQAERMLAQRLEAELPTELLTFEGAEHGFFNDARSPVCTEALSRLLEVLGRS